MTEGISGEVGLWSVAEEPHLSGVNFSFRPH